MWNLITFLWDDQWCTSSNKLRSVGWSIYRRFQMGYKFRCIQWCINWRIIYCINLICLNLDNSECHPNDLYFLFTTIWSYNTGCLGQSMLTLIVIWECWPERKLYLSSVCQAENYISLFSTQYSPQTLTLNQYHWNILSIYLFLSCSEIY